jgi:addiction module HigA family antidote
MGRDASVKACNKLPPVHPGEILLHDFMEPLGLGQSALAEAIGVTPMRVSQIVCRQRAITADTALRLSRYFGTRPGWWLDLQSRDVDEGKVMETPPGNKRGGQRTARAMCETTGFPACRRPFNQGTPRTQRSGNPGDAVSRIRTDP